MKIKIDLDKCRNCHSYICVDCCAKAVFKLEEENPIVADLDSCTGCNICADLCLHKAIVVEA